MAYCVVGVTADAVAGGMTAGGGTAAAIHFAVDELISTAVMVANQFFFCMVQRVVQASLWPNTQQALPTNPNQRAARTVVHTMQHTYRSGKDLWDVVQDWAAFLDNINLIIDLAGSETAVGQEQREIPVGAHETKTYVNRCWECPKITWPTGRTKSGKQVLDQEELLQDAFWAELVDLKLHCRCRPFPECKCPKVTKVRTKGHGGNFNADAWAGLADIQANVWENSCPAH